MRNLGRITAMALFALGSTACGTTQGTDAETGTAAGALVDLRPAQRPPPGSDEAGLWMMMDRAEEKLRTSGNLMRDEALNEYVKGVVCKVAGSYCGDIRVYIVRMPYFNASMAPNGVMQIWTGLILRARSEAQFATIIGHEIGHYLRRHSVQRLRDVRETTNFLIFFQMATAAAGVGYVGDIAQLIALASILAYSRDHEREADTIGLNLLADAGYDPRVAATIWRDLIREEEADDDKELRSLFFATHPAPDERQETLTRLAKERIKDRSPGIEGVEPYRKITGPLRATFLRDEMHLRRFKRAQELLKIHLEDGSNVGELHFFRGEIYRLRDDEGDAEKALEAYEKALATGTAPAKTHRSMGLVYRRSDQPDRAEKAFGKYLELRPDAPDHLMIRSLIKRLG